MFKKIRLHKLGLFCAGSDDIIRLITFENQDDTLQEANNVNTIMEINGKLSTITFNPAYNNLFICSTQGVDAFDLITMKEKSSTLIPISLGKIVDITILSSPNELVITIRDSGALEAWSIADGSRKFSTEIPDQMISHISASPNLPLIVVTSTTGYFYFFEINKDGFRLIHRLRVHSNDIRSIKFNPRGTILVSTGLDNSLFIMEIKTDKITVENIFQIIYRTDLDGEPFALDLDDFENQRINNLDYDEQQQQQNEIDNEYNENIKEKSNETRIVIALNTKTEKFGRFLIIDFDWQQYQGKLIQPNKQKTNATCNFIFLENSKTLITDDSSIKIITKTIFAIHDTIEDFLITAKNQLITIGGKSLRMCRIPDESGKVRKKIIRRNFKINFYTNRIKLNDEDDEA